MCTVGKEGAALQMGTQASSADCPGFLPLHKDRRRAGWTEQYVCGGKRTVSGATSSPGKGYFLRRPSRRDTPSSMPCSDPHRMPRSSRPLVTNLWMSSLLPLGP